ncbi:hypothetical protein V5740_04480 [Croceibacterium sp. TMG7-5b_MA50]|uniref:hypothetical protein n=1 Tax=Croceibacterium sp. TMG7-5b_MA50 TaxID=3121290 RepID=UPI003221B781
MLYSYIDRPVIALERGPQLLVWAMRRWVRDAADGGDPCREIAAAFHAHRLASVLPHFQLAMTLLTTAMREPLLLGDESVAEHEALVLALIRTLPCGSLVQAGDIAGQIVHAGAAPALADALRQLALRLFARDLLCADQAGRASARPPGREGANDTGNA